MKINNNLCTEGLNQAIENSKKSRNSKRMSKIATVIMATMIPMSFTACGGNSFTGTPKEPTSSLKVVDKDISFNVIDDVLETELGVVESEKESHFINEIFDNKASSAELHIKTPQDNLDFVYDNNKSNLSVGEIINNFKDYLSKEDKEENSDFKEVTNGTVKKTSNRPLNTTDSKDYNIFENVYLLRYNQTESIFSIFLLEHTIEFSELENSDSKYTSTPETRSEADTKLKFSAVPLPKVKVKTNN